MRSKLYIICTFTFLSVISCRESSDNFLSSRYNYSENEDDKYHHEEDHTGVGQFKAFWTTLNGLYPIWDYEKEINWDDVYTKYLPIFQEYDRLYYEEGVILSDAEYRKLYVDILSPLHDGHLAVTHLWNPYTKDTLYNNISVSKIRNEKERKDYSYFFSPPDIDYYKEQITEELRSGFSFYCRFNDNILFFRFSLFNLSEIFNPESSIYNDNSELRKAWFTWFNTVQDLYNSGQLKGIIIDVRDNPGGYAADYKYCLGALQQSDSDKNGYHRIGYSRIKTGLGRLDFSPLQPLYYPIYPEPHANIDNVPIAVLCNCYTSSAAEIICYEAKHMKNACLIGMRTWGGVSGFTSGDNTNRSNGNLIGKIAAMFDIDIPDYAFITDEGGILEGIGVEPDIEVPVDLELKAMGRDTQLEYALHYIRNKNQ